MERIYLDHNATTRPDPRVVQAVKEALEDDWGNPSSLHWFGQKARKRLEEARESVAAFIGGEPTEITFTSGGTESNNMAVMGAVTAMEGKGKRIITSTIEHPSVRSTCRSLVARGFDLVEVPVDGSGRVDPQAVAEAMTPDAILVTIMAANNETGVVQPVDEIGRLARERGVLFHTDAVQMAGKLGIDVGSWPVDMLSIAGHKFYGPKGVGALWVKKGLRIAPRNLGGGQEMGMRGGTENIPGICGLGRAAEIARAERGQWETRIRGLRDRFEKKALEKIENAEVHGDLDNRLPNTSSISFPGAEGEAVAITLDLKGVAVSTGSACSTGATSPSHVLMAMGLSARQCETALRISLGKDNTREEIDRAVELLAEAVARIRSIAQ